MPALTELGRSFLAFAAVITKMIKEWYNSHPINVQSEQHMVFSETSRKDASRLTRSYTDFWSAHVWKIGELPASLDCAHLHWKSGNYRRLQGFHDGKISHNPSFEANVLDTIQHILLDCFWEALADRDISELTRADLLRAHRRFVKALNSNYVYSYYSPMFNFDADVHNTQIGRYVRLERFDLKTKEFLWNHYVLPARGISNHEGDINEFTESKYLLYASESMADLESRSPFHDVCKSEMYDFITALRLVKPGLVVASAVYGDLEPHPNKRGAGANTIAKIVDHVKN